MKLVSFRITNYWCIEDSEDVGVDPDVTCFVGKNESGKTALLRGLHRVNPLQADEFEASQDYPRRKYNKYRRERKRDPDLPADVAVKAVFELEPDDNAKIEEQYGEAVVTAPEVEVAVDYDNKKHIGVEIDESSFVQNLVAQAELSDEVSDNAKVMETVQDLDEFLKDGESTEGEKSLRKTIEPYLAADLAEVFWEECLSDLCPKFLFFDEYDLMAGSAPINELEKEPELDNDRSLRTLKDLLDLAGTTLGELQNQADYETYKANLEATALEITDEIFEFWSQNRDREVEFDVAGSPPEFHVRIKNTRHGVTVSFDQRSRGFVWFFSFLTKFNRIAETEDSVILLLDEPGLNLHASAQGDLLRFINERLAPDHQVIYTTHSPFMIDPTNLERVRTIEDTPDEGAKVSNDCLTNDSATVFPLQAALGYDLAQTLFLGPDCLLVEGVSDLLYLQVMSEIVEERRMAALSEEWVLTPVAGADKLSTFVALLGPNQLNIAVLTDVAPKDQQRIDNLVEKRLLEENKIVHVADFVDQKHADIEDLLGTETYLDLVNEAYPGEDLDESDLPEHQRLVIQVEKAMDERDIPFSHLKPARVALEKLDSDKASEEAVERFGELFEHLNGLLET